MPSYRLLLVGLLASLAAPACNPSVVDDLGGDEEGPPVDPGAPPATPTPSHDHPPPIAQPADGGTPTPETPPTPEDPPTPTEPATVALLEIHAMDLWAQYLGDDAVLEVDVDGMPVAAEGPIARLALTDASLVTVRLSAPEHDPMEVSVGFTGAGDLGAVVLDDDGGAEGRAGIAMSHDLEKAISGRPALPVHRLYLGLRHRWFSASGRPARHGNFVRVFMDGEEAWANVATALRAAKKSILLATWFFESDFELVRDAATHVTSTQTERSRNTMLAMLEGSGAYKRVLVGEFWRQDGTLSTLSSDDAIRSKGKVAGDRFEYLGQANEMYGKSRIAIEPFSFEARVTEEQPAAAARAFESLADIRSTVAAYDEDLSKAPIDVEVQLSSNHQKFMVLDDDTAFVGGMNVKLTDWDTSRHLVFDPRRMDFKSDTGDRQDVADHEALSDTGPRKDYMVEVVGPAAQDVAEVFQRRWDLAIDDQVEYAQNASRFDITRDRLWYGDTQVQVTTTLPSPIAEHSIMESWLNAVGQAETYIYIEDQYFRAMILNAAIRARMRARPKLKLVVVTKPISEWTDPACEWTSRSYHDLVDEFGSARVKFLQLRSFDTQVTLGFDETDAVFLDMDVHSKMLIVDDKFMSVGSANKNNRGMLSEAEMNVAILDPGIVRATMGRILENLAPKLNLPGQPFDVWWGKLGEVATWNDWVRAKWKYEDDDLDLDGDPLPSVYQPLGFVYSLSFAAPDKCLIEGLGPDIF